MKNKSLFVKTIIFACIFLAENSIVFSQWTQLSTWEGFSFATEGNSYIYAGSLNSYGLFVSSNNGDNWTNVIQNHNIRSIAVVGSTIYASDTSTFISTNHGLSWTVLNNFPVNIRNLVVQGTNIYGISSGIGVYGSIDLGNSWSLLSSSIAQTNYGSSLAVDGNNLFYSTFHHNNVPAILYLTTNTGNSWNDIYYGDPTGLTSVYPIVFDSNHNMYAGTYSNGIPNGALLFSSNYGFNWNNISSNIPQPNILAITLYGNNIFIGNSGSSTLGTDTGGIYISGNNGASWIKKSEGINTIQVGFDFIKVFNNYVFTSTQHGIYRRPLSELTSVSNSQNNIPDKFSLSQNYPNPFNPSTKISYDLPVNGLVNLVIYDVLGREVITLVNEKQNAGSYNVNWNVSNNPSGVYFYKLTFRQAGSSTGEFTQTRKMTLIK